MATPIPGSGYELRWQAHNSERRELILRAAAELVEESDSDAPISVQRIADRAGLVKSVVYRQFKGKDDLTRSLRGYVVESFAAELEVDLDISTGSLRSILHRAISSAAQWMQNNPRLVDLLRSGPTDHGPQGPTDAIGELKERIVSRGQQTINDIATAAELDGAVFTRVPFVIFTMVEATLTSWVRGERSIRDQSRAELVASLTDITWFVLDGAARSIGLIVDPDADFSAVIATLTPARTASSPPR
jgi:AcrR family transcriptional regulator